MQLLVVEDDIETGDFLVRSLAEHGFSVELVRTGEEGLERCLADEHGLVLLDVRLPGLDGFEILRRVRDRGVQTPVLFLSAHAEVHQRIEGLNLGADDFVSKPFSVAELVARIRSVERRHAGVATDQITVGDLAIDRVSHRVTRGQVRIDLTPKEFELLWYLATIAGQVATRRMITAAVWGEGFEGFSNVVDVHINRLRRKIDRGAKQKLVHTVTGTGYVLEARS